MFLPKPMRALILPLCLALLMTAGSAARAAPGAPAAAPPAADFAPVAKQFVSRLGNEALTVLSQNKGNRTAMNTRFRDLLGRNFDVPWIGRFVLGRYWREASPAQQTEYLALFEKLIIQTYSDRFDAYAGEKFEVFDSKLDKDGDAMVDSRISPPGNAPPVGVSWRVRKGDQTPRVIDVVVEGVSMAVTQRQEFATVIGRQGGAIEGLLVELRKKTGGAR